MARDAPSIDAYGEGGFRLAGEWRDGSVMIVKDEARAWPVASLAEVTLETLAPILEAGKEQVELVLLGAGRVNGLPSRAVRDGMLRAGIGLEFMDTPAAARLYNVLTADGRRVAAALIAV